MTPMNYLDAELIDSVNSLAFLLEAPAANPKRSLEHPDHAKRITPIQKRVKKIVAGYFRRQKKAILEDVRLRFHVGKEYKEAASDKTPGEKRAEQLLPVGLSPLNFATTAQEGDDYRAAIAAAILAAEQQLAEEIGTNKTIGENRMTKYLEENSLSKLSGEMSDFTKQRLRSAIADAIDSGGTADEIVAAIEDTMEDFSTKRAELVAQNEVATAYSWARHQIADDAGLNEKRWVPESGNPCQICIDNEDQDWIDITEAFESGDQFPIAHVNCLCGCDYRLVTAGEGR